MTISLQNALHHLYDVAVRQGKSQSPDRLRLLGEYCIQELAARGLTGAQGEQIVPGGGRPKSWDIVWKYDGKCRLAISLKSILRNLAGTVPNRLDDLMGEVANAQLHSPEIVLGYVMILNIADDAHSIKHGSTWSDLLRSRLENLSGRCPPSWTIGTIEAFAYVEVNFREGPMMLPAATSFERFFDTLAQQVRLRNPNAPRTADAPAAQPAPPARDA